MKPASGSAAIQPVAGVPASTKATGSQGVSRSAEIEKSAWMLPAVVLDVGKALVAPFLSFIGSRIGTWRSVRVLVHRAHLGNEHSEKFFINVTNLSPNREVEVDRVYFDVLPHVEVLNPERPLPKRLRLDESWETWCDVDPVKGWRLEWRCRVRLSSGSVVRSRPRRENDVGPAGNVPGP
jgi:hypothetical protein